jgi:hypothetical protein
MWAEVRVAFSGRSSLLSLIDQLIRVNGGRQVAADTVRPALVLEGIGGSGRSEVLQHTWGQWAASTPTAFVDPVAVEDDDSDSMRNVLFAVMLGLTADVHGYKISFPRVVLAHIAMAEPIRSPDPGQSVKEMHERFNTYRDQGTLATLIGSLVQASGGLLQIPGIDGVAALAEQVVAKLNRTGWRTGLTWKKAREWFGHQDQGFHHDPLRALVHLSVQAQSQDVSVREDVDHLLMAALLADLRDAFTRAVNHPANAVVLLDNGEDPSATEFMRTLAKVRRELKLQRKPRDPLTVITTSGGLLLADTDNGPPVWSESDLPHLTADDVTRAGDWLRVVLGGLTFDDIQRMARAEVWPASLGIGTSVISSTIHRLTGGHAEATNLVLNRLKEQPRLIDDLGTVLGTVEQHLIDRIAAGLSPRRHIDPHLRDDLITLAAARDNVEARQLMSLIGNPVDAEPVLFTSTTLWSAPGPRGHPALEPFVRRVLLRALATRPAAHRVGWHEVFTTLRTCAERSGDDVAGRLHHELALGNLDTVVDELYRLLPEKPGAQWLALLDQAVATPNLRSPGNVPASDDDEARPRDHRGYVARLVTTLYALADPRLSDRSRLRQLYRAVSHDYGELRDRDLVLFLDRARHYQKLADALA